MTDAAGTGGILQRRPKGYRLMRLPWWWGAAAFWLVAGPWAILTSRRRRRSAQALRDRAFA